jgi:serine/threonine protein kinase
MKRLLGHYSASGWDDFVSFRELQSLMRISRHPNIVQIHEVHLTDKSSLLFLFEYMNGGSLFDLITSRLQQQQQHQTTTNHNLRLLPEEQIQSILRQTLQGLSHMHKEGYFHRDMKPENILLDTTGVCKVADFSLARKYQSRRHDSLPCNGSPCTTTTMIATAVWHDHDPLTSYISTRWYRAPEILLGMPDYGPAVDAFAMACIAAECFMGRPLIPGKSEVDQLHCTFQLLGEPTRQCWKQGCEYNVQAQSHFSAASSPSPTIATLSRSPASHVSTNSAESHLNTSRLLQQVLHMASRQAIDLIARLVRLNPDKRLTCEGALNHGFLRQSSAYSSSSLSQPTQKRQSSLATVCEETSSAGESAAREAVTNVSPTSKSPTKTVAAPSPSPLLSPEKGTGETSTAKSAVPTTASMKARTLDTAMLATPVNAVSAKATFMTSSRSFNRDSSSSSSTCSTCGTSSGSSEGSSSMSSDSSDASSDDESIMSTPHTKKRTLPQDDLPNPKYSHQTISSCHSSP